MKVSIGADLIIGFMLPPAMIKPPNTQTIKTTIPIIAFISLSKNGQTGG
jgi:hypothetical protein